MLVRRIIRSAFEELARTVRPSVRAALDRGRRPHRLLGNSCFPASEGAIWTCDRYLRTVEIAFNPHNRAAVYASAW